MSRLHVHSPVEKCLLNSSCDITAVFGLLRDTAVTNSYKKKGPPRFEFSAIHGKSLLVTLFANGASNIWVPLSPSHCPS